MKLILWFVRVWAIFLIGLHLAAPFLPEDDTWGLFPYTYWPLWLQWAGAVFGLALCLGPFNRGVRDGLSRLTRFWPSDRRRYLGYAAISLFMAIPFWLGRIVHTRWGDAYILTRAIAHPEVRLTYTWQAPFDVFLHSKAWQLANGLWGWDVMQVYHVLSVATGVIFVFLLLCMADDLGANRRESAAIVGMLGSLGIMQFFFGYIENYVFITIGILGYLWLGMRQIARQTDLTWPAVTLALSNAFHPSTIFGLQLSMLWLWFRELRQGARELWRHRVCTTAKFALPMLVVFALVILMMELGSHGTVALLTHDAPGGGDQKWFVPLFEVETKWERYTMFSPAHLLEIANQQLLVQPFSLALIAALLASRRGRGVLRTPQGTFLGTAGACYFWFTLVWNPDYGGRRDWDLFAPASLAVTLLAAWLLIASSRMAEDEGEKSRLSEIALIVVGVTLIFTAAWVYSNTIPWSWETGHG